MAPLTTMKIDQGPVGIHHFVAGSGAIIPFSETQSFCTHYGSFHQLILSFASCSFPSDFYFFDADTFKRGMLCAPMFDT